jgi:hypothetical protein
MHRLLLILPALLLFALAACGGDDDDTDAPTTPAAPAAEGTPAETDSDDDDADAPDPSNGAGAEEFAALFRNFATATFRVTWQMETTFDGESFTGEMTWYQDSPNQRHRFDFDSAGMGFEGSMTMIQTADDTLTCFDGTCLSAGAMPMFDDPAEDLTEQFEELEQQALAGNIRPAGTRTIAGTQAICFEFDAGAIDDDDGTVVACISPEGVPLYSEWESVDGRSLMEATSYSTSVSDSDFEPPYPVMTLPTP